MILILIFGLWLFALFGLFFTSRGARTFILLALWGWEFESPFASLFICDLQTSVISEQLVCSSFLGRSSSQVVCAFYFVRYIDPMKNFSFVTKK